MDELGEKLANQGYLKMKKELEKGKQENQVPFSNASGQNPFMIQPKKVENSPPQERVNLSEKLLENEEKIKPREKLEKKPVLSEVKEDE